MALKQGTIVPMERDPADIAAVAPVRAYFENHPTVSGRYVLTTSSDDATAFLKADPIASALGRFVLDSDRAEEDRQLFQFTPTLVVA